MMRPIVAGQLAALWETIADVLADTLAAPQGALPALHGKELSPEECAVVAVGLRLAARCTGMHAAAAVPAAPEPAPAPAPRKRTRGRPRKAPEQTALPSSFVAAVEKLPRSSWAGRAEHESNGGAALVPPAPAPAPAGTGWSCIRNGHVYDGGRCGYCGQATPADPASGNRSGAA